MVIVEGPDGAGKTTLVRDICSEFGLVQGERGTKDRDRLYTVTQQDTHKALAQAVMCNESVRVWDRLFYSELVYAPVVGRPVEFQAKETEFIASIIQAIQVPFILCLPPLDIVRRNIWRSGQMAGVKGHIERIYRDYERMWKARNSGLLGEHIYLPSTTQLYDYTGHEGKDRDAIMAGIGFYLEERVERML